MLDNWKGRREEKKELFYKWVEENLSTDQKANFWKVYTDYLLFKASNEKRFWTKLIQDLKNK